MKSGIISNGKKILLRKSIGRLSTNAVRSEVFSEFENEPINIPRAMKLTADSIRINIASKVKFNGMLNKYNIKNIEINSMILSTKKYIIFFSIQIC